MNEHVYISDLESKIEYLEKKVKKLEELPPPVCSFCGKHKDYVNHMIKSSRAYICNECVELCYEIIKEKEEDEQV